MTDYYVIARELNIHNSYGQPDIFTEYATKYYLHNLWKYLWDDDVFQAVEFNFLDGAKRIKALNDKFSAEYDYRFYLARPQIYSFDEIR